jgi:diguanylate cyclase (GGDEF)-like protein
MNTSKRGPSTRATPRRARPIWIVGLAGQPAKRIRQAVGQAHDVRRFDPRDLPGQPEYDKASPLAVFLDLTSLRSLELGQAAWLDGARRILVIGEGEEASHDEVLSRGFVACLNAPLNKARVTAALNAAAEAAGAYEDMGRILGEAQREREQMARENGRLAFFQHILTRAMSTLDLGGVLSALREDLALAFPVPEVLGVFWGDEPECEMVMPENLSPKATSARVGYLLDLASRLRGAPSSSYRVHPSPGGGESAQAEPGRALLAPLRLGDSIFGCLCVLIQRDLSKHEQETARQALSQLAPVLKNALDYLRLKRRADRDGLTGAANRRSFDARLEQEFKRHMRHKEGFSLILADLDHFKKINDTHGHLAGDAALRHAAATLEAGLRSTDFMARFGGEEFAVILPHTGQAQAWMLAERLRRRLASTSARYAGRSIPVTASMGLACFTPGQAATPAGLVALADEALYQSKRAGRNRVSIASGREERRAADTAHAPLLAG